MSNTLTQPIKTTYVSLLSLVRWR